MFGKKDNTLEILVTLEKILDHAKSVIEANGRLIEENQRLREQLEKVPEERRTFCVRFRVTSSGAWGDDQATISNYPCLKDYGLEVEKIKIPITRRIRDEKGNWINFETGKYRVQEKSYITINDLNELMKFIKDCESCVIVSDDEIEIYDSYRE